MLQEEDDSRRESFVDQIKTRFGVCGQCHIKITNPILCEKCEGIFYCSDGCRTEHWPDHKGACKLSILSGPPPETMQRIVNLHHRNFEDTLIVGWMSAAGHPRIMSMLISDAAVSTTKNEILERGEAEVGGPVDTKKIDMFKKIDPALPERIRSNIGKFGERFVYLVAIILGTYGGRKFTHTLVCVTLLGKKEPPTGKPPAIEPSAVYLLTR